MRRILLNLSVAAVTFLVGSGLAGMWLVYSRAQLLEIEAEELMGVRPAKSKPSDPQDLKVVGGMDACGPKANYHTRNLSDGTTISFDCEHLSSPARAAQELQKRLDQPVEIIERRPQLDDKGRIVGERVVIKSFGVVLLKTYENNFCTITAPSLEHLKWFETRKR